jgi:hypothetical protein
MARRTRAVAFLVALFPLTGCSIFQPKPAETNLDRLKRVENVYNTTVRVLLLARTQGELGDADYEQITKLVHVGDNALTELNKLAAQNPNFQLDENEFFVLLNSALDQLTLYSTRYSSGPGNNRPAHTRLFNPDWDLRGPPTGGKDGPQPGRGSYGDAAAACGGMGRFGAGTPRNAFATF